MPLLEFLSFLTKIKMDFSFDYDVWYSNYEAQLALALKNCTINSAGKS
jgi:hypothetical protein